VDQHFRRLFTALFEGGQAHLALVDSDDPLEAGLEIFAQPPGKRLQSLTLLSGGEQALTAVALIFALFLTNPAPICVLDEVDAPLDDANIERFCDLLDAMVGETDTRYLIVTHNAVTMSRMHRLFGVTMIEKGVSRLVGRPRRRRGTAGGGVVGQDTLGTRSTLNVGGKDYAYYSLAKAAEKLGDISRLPFSMKVLLENLLRFEDGGFTVSTE
jgi:ABC-type multidrug transport system ATPase subunit